MLRIPFSSRKNAVFFSRIMMHKQHSESSLINYILPYINQSVVDFLLYPSNVVHSLPPFHFLYRQFQSKFSNVSNSILSVDKIQFLLHKISWEVHTKDRVRSDNLFTLSSWVQILSKKFQKIDRACQVQRSYLPKLKTYCSCALK